MVWEFRNGSEASGRCKVIVEVRFGKASKLEEFWLRRKEQKGLRTGAW